MDINDIYIGDIYIMNHNPKASSKYVLYKEKALLWQPFHHCFIDLKTHQRYGTSILNDESYMIIDIDTIELYDSPLDHSNQMLSKNLIRSNSKDHTK